MRKLVLVLLVTTFAPQTIKLYSQALEKPSPGFTLTISKGRHGGEISQNILVLSVKMTNTTDHVISRSFCRASGGMYNVEVKYNGIPIETEVSRRVQKSRETGLCIGWGKRDIDPGESADSPVYYKPTRSGSYEFTAEQDSSPLDPKTNVIVRSNTLKIVVSETDLIDSK